MSIFTVFAKDGKKELQRYTVYKAADHADAIGIVKSLFPDTAKVFVDLSLTIEDEPQKEAA